MQNIRIVYIDDDEEDIFLFRQHLKRLSSWNISFTPVIDIENEIDKLFGSNFDEIFLNYYFDNTDGLEVLSVLRAFGIDVPVIFLTDRQLTKGEIKNMKQLGSFDYISKSSFNSHSVNNVLENVKINKKLSTDRWGDEISRFKAVFAFHK